MDCFRCSAAKAQTIEITERDRKNKLKGEVKKTDAKKAKHTHAKSSWPAVQKPKKAKACVGVISPFAPMVNPQIDPVQIASSLGVSIRVPNGYGFQIESAL